MCMYIYGWYVTPLEKIWNKGIPCFKNNLLIYRYITVLIVLYIWPKRVSNSGTDLKRFTEGFRLTPWSLLLWQPIYYPWEVQPPFCICRFMNHHCLSKGFSSSKRNPQWMTSRVVISLPWGISIWGEVDWVYNGHLLGRSWSHHKAHAIISEDAAWGPQNFGSNQVFFIFFSGF